AIRPQDTAIQKPNLIININRKEAIRRRVTVIQKPKVMGVMRKKEQRKAGEKLVVMEMPAVQYPCQKMSEVSNFIFS
ncbi:TPA: hypothetical protein I7721_21940, partial [Vibrio vulnificus]|nr:hypothetical protein [Vibrio vulnificus]